MMKVLITGGAGFIGSNLVKRLLENGIPIRILDPLTPQVHGVIPNNVDWLLDERIEFIRGSVTERKCIEAAIIGVTHIIHLAAETGTGQSMYEVERYFNVNVQGTALLLDTLQNSSMKNSLQSIIVASSRAIIGEGAYECVAHGIVYPNSRSREQLSAGNFEPICPHCAAAINLTFTSEAAPYKPMSVYGLTKQVQEQAVLMYARTAGINAFALRYQNVYGPGQSLKNPYTGILAVFSNLARQNQNIDVYEDGRESRDFVYIDDVVESTLRAIMYKEPFVGALNVGSGISTTVMAVAQAVKTYFKSDSNISVTGAFRVGDIRHNMADTTLLQQVLNFTPRTSFQFGLGEFLSWASKEPEQDKTAYENSIAELTRHGLMGGK